VGLGCPASAGLGWTTPSGVGAAATAIRLLGIHGDAGLASRLQPVGVLALRCVDPAVTNGGALGLSEPLFSLVWFLSASIVLLVIRQPHRTVETR
jgi:hypothetical protein